MGHVVLLGDSIFDNKRYVPDRPPVIEQVRQTLGSGWSATLLAVDGHITQDVAKQLQKLPPEATHLVVSAGGNDALSESSILNKRVSTVEEALGLIDDTLREFKMSYRAMLMALGSARKPTTVCTVYDAIPYLGRAEKAALAGFNEIILREAFTAGLPVIDLRLICSQTLDYSHVSPIEPSAVGGAKIARVIAQTIIAHDFASSRSTIYT